MTEIEAKLRNLRLTLPEPLKTPPGLKLPFKPVIVRGKHVYISGHAPQNPDGTIAGPLGKLGKELTLEQGYQAAKLGGPFDPRRFEACDRRSRPRLGSWPQGSGHGQCRTGLQSDHRRHKRVQRTHHRALWT